MTPEDEESTDFYNFKGKITLELEIDSDDFGSSHRPKVTVTGMTKEQLYWLFEGADLSEDLGNYVYEHIARMEN